MHDPAEPMPLVGRSLVLDIDRRGELVVAVGERGHVLVSADGGETFEQGPSPVRSALTAVALGEDAALAVGHDGVVLRSEDPETGWEVVFSAPDEQRPLLDVSWLDGESAIAVGAYGWILRSDDGGRSWMDDSIDPGEPHVNMIARGDDGLLMAAAEFGLAFRSEDRGRTFELIELPYQGSLFGTLFADGAWLVFGLRGRVFWSDDRGDGWEAVRTGTDASLLAGTVTAGDVVLGGLAGTLLVSGDGGRSFTVVQDSERRGISAMVELEGGTLLLAGEGGLRRMSDVHDARTMVDVTTADGGS
jgi:photosystem II stability/assembly factor-like uncharacterized protein